MRHLIGLAAVLSCLALPMAAADETGGESVAAAFDMHRCVNMGNSLEAPRGHPWGAPIDVAKFPEIRAMGVDTVRIPIRWTDYAGAGPDYTIEADFLADVDRIVQAALDAGLNVMINLHHFDGIHEAPEANMPELLAVWRQIAEHYAGAPDDLWFEVLNEPHDNLRGEVLRGAQAEMIATVRASNPDRILIIGGEHFSGISTLDTNMAAPDANVIYTFHYYDPFSFTHQKATWLGDAMPKGTRDWGSDEDWAELHRAAGTATAYREASGRPVFLGEFGVIDAVRTSRRAKWLKAVREEMEGADIPWCVWAYSNTFPIYDNRSGRYNKKLVKALGLDLPPKK